MKVGIDISQCIYGTGVSDYTLELVRHLPQSELALIGFSLRRTNDLTRLVPGCSTYPIPPSLLHVIWNKLHIVNFENFSPEKIDVYHSSDWTQAPSKAAKVTTVHDLSPFLYPRETSSQVVAAQTARMRRVVKECDTIICVSQNTANDMVKLFPETTSRLTVILEALPSRFNVQPSSNTSQSYIVAIGARSPRKNITRLISACSNLSQKLIIIGEKPNHLEGGRMDSSQVEFTGYVSDQELVNYLAGAQAFVYPSLYEGFGLPILGAFHHQVPVACSDIPVFHETAGLAASFFNPLDEQSIASGISSAIKNKKSLIAAGTKQLSKFSWEKTARETLKLYQQLC